MASSLTADSLWSEIMEDEEGVEDHGSNHQHHPQAIYQRRRPPKGISNASQATANFIYPNRKQSDSSNENNRVSLGNPKRISWNRSLSIRGRVSIAVSVCVDVRPQQKQVKRKGKPPVPKAKSVQPPNFETERQYFQEVDAFELVEESPSPKNFHTWATRNQTGDVPIPHLSSRLERWLITKKLDCSCEPSTTLSKILETPTLPVGLECSDDYSSINLKTPVDSSSKTNSALHSLQTRISRYILSKDAVKINSRKSSSILASFLDENCEQIEAATKKLSLVSSRASLDNDYVDPFASLLAVCGQSVPSTLLDVFSKYCDPKSITKVGEGTYGEAFKAGNTVCKIVPIDGDLRVNGEVQKRSEELLEEVILSRTLNRLRAIDSDAYNMCTTFIETLDLRVCQGPYDLALIKAWEDWDEKHGSENDHPKEFPAKQCYVVFVLQHGGKDLESFVLLNFDEARSLLVQVTAALAVAEAAYEFEHRDLHWGNILLSRNDCATVHFALEGKKIYMKTFGLAISIIDFTLSRINTGEDILYLDLSSDPYLFKGPKGDKQAETYRKMKELTEDFWEGSFPRTNVFWLLYLVDILLLKKSFDRSSKHERDLRSLKKRLDKYNSAKEAILDPFFTELFLSCE
ncbi:hypothetical protein K2173_003924 [Erythroxylum novogranatense]|uniref:non-specific serine/threonine protein kinase n=1 Tax=Erythroxylum novogranatense TaxID=1862640 RepID=A0AAV8SJQ4_9ROSI|nr:hypothetical protein K2173_003924 [Erythroxylum novogranatense]